MRKKLSNLDGIEVLRRFRAEELKQDIADAFNIDLRNLTRFLRRAGAPTRKPGRRPKNSELLKSIEAMIQTETYVADIKKAHPSAKTKEVEDILETLKRRGTIEQVSYGCVRKNLTPTT